MGTVTSTFRYRHSGRFPLPGVALSLVAGTAAGVILAFVYAYLVLYIPLAGYLTFILTAGFGGLAGGATGVLLHWQKVRNNAVALSTRSGSTYITGDNSAHAAASSSSGEWVPTGTR